MAPKLKRAGDGDPVRPTKRPGKPTTPGGDVQRVPLDMFSGDSRPWICLVVRTVSVIHERGQSLHQWLLDKISDLGVNHWVDMLDTAFPPVSNISYAKADTLGEPCSKKLPACGCWASTQTVGAAA